MEHRYRKVIYEKYISNAPKELEACLTLDFSNVEPTFRVRYLPLLPKDKACHILDIGSGTGHFLEFLKQAGYHNCSGIDSGREVSAFARSRGLSVEIADAFDYLKSHIEKFDCITALDVLEHFTKDEVLDLMEAIYRALKPGGCFVAHTANADSFSWGRMRHIDYTHENSFTRYSLGGLFNALGFHRHEFHPMDPIVISPRSFFRYFLWRVFRALAGLYYHLQMGSGILNNDHILTETMVLRTFRPVHGSHDSNGKFIPASADAS